MPSPDASPDPYVRYAPFRHIRSRAKRWTCRDCSRRSESLRVEVQVDRRIAHCVYCGCTIWVRSVVEQ